MKLKKLSIFHQFLIVIAIIGFILGLMINNLFLDFLLGGSLF